MSDKITHNPEAHQKNLAIMTALKSSISLLHQQLNYIAKLKPLHQKQQHLTTKTNQAIDILLCNQFPLRLF